jgi:hypothetical protein
VPIPGDNRVALEVQASQLWQLPQDVKDCRVIDEVVLKVQGVQALAFSKVSQGVNRGQLVVGDDQGPQVWAA